MLGIPSIQIKAYNNQEYNYNEFLNSNLIIKLSNFSKKNLLNAFSSLKNKKYKIFKLSFPLYCKKNYFFIYNLLFKNKNLYTNYVSLKPISTRDIKFLFYIQNKENIRKYFKKKSKISITEHKKWFKIKFNDNKVIIYKICLGNLNIGYFKLENINIATYDISILIDPDFQKRGFANKILNKIKKIMSDKKLIAEVHKENLISKKLFINNGFRVEKSKNNFDFLSFENAKK
jgi:Acetyltransferases, including N-acetylases of ribosomal proteins